MFNNLNSKLILLLFIKCFKFKKNNQLLIIEVIKFSLAINLLLIYFLKIFKHCYFSKFFEHYYFLINSLKDYFLSLANNNLVFFVHRE